jgi:hypothetical protein
MGLSVTLCLFVNNLISLLSNYLLLQDPAEADKLTKIQRDLDETKIILVSNAISYELIMLSTILFWVVLQEI